MNVGKPLGKSCQMTTDQQSSGLDFPEMTESKPKTQCQNRLRNITTTPNAYNPRDMGQLLHNKNRYYQSANTVNVRKEFAVSMQKMLLFC